MGFLARSSFAKGWVPDADPANGPADGLLRADNGILDELGVLAVRPGSAKINSVALADTDIHSLFTGYLSGTRYRMAGAANAVYANGTSISSGVAGSGDIAFGSHLGQILFARSTTKKKYDGTTVRNLGIAMTGGALTAAALAADSDTFATFASGETTWTDNFGTSANATGYDGTANAAKAVTVNTTNGIGMISKRFASDQDFSTYSGGATGMDDDTISFYVNITDPLTLHRLVLLIDVNSASANVFQDDYYFHTWEVQTQSQADAEDPLSSSYTSEGANRDRVDAAGTTTLTQAQLQPGWNKITVRRGDMKRFGGTTGKNWSTVRGVRVQADTVGAASVTFDELVISGGTTRPISGKVTYRYVYVRNDGTYTAKSAPSAVSAEYNFANNGGDLTVPSDGSRDSQINEIWVFRMNTYLGSFYRVKVQTGVSGTGSVSITDTTSDVDALIANVRLETDNAVPPSNIISMAGPYYDRTMYLTSDGLVYPSRQLNPDSCSAGQAIRVTGVDETPYWIKKAFGGLYVGTSKDVYRLEGTGAELPDDSMDFSLAPLNIDHPPRSEAVAQEGDLLIYLASDGWRALNGSASKSLTGATSLLYRGQDRHGVSAVNLSTGRFRAAITKGQLIATTPEGASTTTTAVLYRLVFDKGWWYRHTYGSQAWKCLHREPDGTLIASDTAGFVWTLDTGTQDASSDIAVVIWTKVDDNGNPFVRKRPYDIRLHVDTGGNTLTAGVHLDASSSATVSVTAANTGFGVDASTLSDYSAGRQIQLRMTGSFSTFKFAGFSLGYHDLPMPVRGRLQDENFGYGGIKTMSGLQLRLCTLGEAVTVTPIVDGTEQTTFSVTTGSDQPEDYTHPFAAALEGARLALSFSGDVELYSWQPLVTAKRPLGVKAFDSGPLDLGVHELVWLREVRLKVRAGAQLTVTPYFDGVAFTAYTTTDAALGVDTIISIPIGRAYKGKIPRVVITSSGAFYPYWISFIRRTTGAKTDTPELRVPFNLGGDVAA
mgnify:CR=1 FL=1